jgi:hypothetical protein
MTAETAASLTAPAIADLYATDTPQAPEPFSSAPQQFQQAGWKLASFC